MAASTQVGDSAQFVEGINRAAFVPAVFGRVLAGILELVFVGFAVVTSLSGPINLIYTSATLLCATMFAYLVQLLILAANDSYTNHIGRANDYAIARTGNYFIDPKP